MSIIQCLLHFRQDFKVGIHHDRWYFVTNCNSLSWYRCVAIRSFTCHSSADEVWASFKQSKSSLPRSVANIYPDNDPSPAPVQPNPSISGAFREIDLSLRYKA